MLRIHDTGGTAFAGIFLKAALTCCLLAAGFTAGAQFKVGNNPTVIDPAAALQIESSNQGVLLPRINDTAVSPLSAAPDGTIIYFTDSVSPSVKTGPAAGLYVRRNNVWQRMETVGSAWRINGNGGTDTGSFVGTTDNKPLRLKSNNTVVGILHPDNISFGANAMRITGMGADQQANIALGNYALSAATSGENNIAIGNKSLKKANGNQTLDELLLGNTAVGGFAMEDNEKGSYNTAVGDSALAVNRSGNYNTAVGAQAGVSDDNLSFATAIGYNARVSKSNAIVLGDTSDDNLKVGIGRSAPEARLHVRAAAGSNPLVLEGVPSASAADSVLTINAATGVVGKRTVSNLVSGTAWGLNGNAGTSSGVNFIGTTDTASLRFRVDNNPAGLLAVSNTAFGYATMLKISGLRNAAFGTGVLNSSTSGTNNVGVGYYASYFNTTGSGNVAVGTEALRQNTTGNSNTAVGDSALTKSTATGNVAVGSRSLRYNTTGAENTAVGSNTLYTNSTGANNTAIGAGALRNNTTGSRNVAIGDSVLYTSTSSQNTAVGSGALRNNTVGGANAAFGAFALESTIGGASNTAIGHSAGQYNTDGYFNTSVGNYALQGNTTGNSNTGMGYQALMSSTTTSGNTAVGAYALKTIQNTGNTAVGLSALENATTGVRNTAIGYYAARGVAGTPITGSYNIAIGYQPLAVNTTGSENVAIGYSSAANTEGSKNVAIGDSSLFGNTTGNTNVAVGISALRNNVTGTNNSALGYSANVLAPDLQNTTVIGYNARVNRSNSIILGDTSNNNLNVGIGRNAPQAKLHVRATSGNNPLILEGTPSGVTTDSILTINGTTGVVGKLPVNTIVSGTGWSLNGNTGVTSSNFIGTDGEAIRFKIGADHIGIITPASGAGMNTVSLGYKSYDAAAGANITAIGAYALNKQNLFSLYSTAVGYSSLRELVSGTGNTALGYEAGKGASNVMGDSNVFIGYRAGYSFTNVKANTAVGSQALYATTTGGQNVALGESALYTNTTGSGNTALGHHANVTAGNLTDATAIGANALVSRSHSIVLGDTSNNDLNVGIGRGAPQAKLHVRATAGNNPLIVEGIPSGAATDSILTINTTSGLVGKRPANSLGWGLKGNSGTDTATNFIGTTDNMPLRFVINNIRSGILSDINASYGYATLMKNVVNINAQTGIYNTAMGSVALQNNQSGAGNTAVGAYASNANTTGAQNTSVGMFVLAQNTTGNANTAIGSRALQSNVSGSSNVAIGDSVLHASTASDNTAVGARAMRSNTTGTDNLAFGYGALYANTTGYMNVALGQRTLMSNIAGSGNVAIGNRALFTNNYGTGNIALGDSAMYSNTASGLNVAIGKKALFTNTTGNENVALGNNAMSSNTQGAGNVAIGTNSMRDNTTGNDNLAIGNQSNWLNQAGQANVSVGSYSLNNNNGGGNNTAIGFRALNSNITGTGNTALGHYADVSGGALTNATAIGYGAIVNATNKVRIGNANVSVIEGQVAWSNPSDARFKDNVTANVPGLSLITRLKPVTYHFDTRRQEEHITGKTIADNTTYRASYKKLHTGFLAQDVEAICKEIGFDFDAIHIPENERDYYSLSYNQFIMPLVKAVQEQQEMIEQQKTENITLQAKLEAQQQALDAVLKRLEQLEQQNKQTKH